MSIYSNNPETPIDALIIALQACHASPDGMTRPAAILWTDPKRQWLPIKPLLLQRLPELVILDTYDPNSRSGPAIWIRCVVERTLEKSPIPEGKVPIIYLPGVSRQDLRAGEDCPASLIPLVELMFRGNLWLQRNGSDWTVTAFLTSPQGLKLDLARDKDTLEALSRTMYEVAVTPLPRLSGKRLEAEDFDRMLSSDSLRDLLRWMSAPSATKEQMPAQHWSAFCNQSKKQFNFDPSRDSEITAGERLGRGEGPWFEAWERFVETPRSYPGIPDLLRRSKPMDLLLEPSRWPDINEEGESKLRSALMTIPQVAHIEACRKILQLEEEHGARRNWVWAQLGLSTMAVVLERLTLMAKVTQRSVGGSTPNEIARLYMEGHWEADAASWEVISHVSTPDESLIKNTVRALLMPWLEESARAFQLVVEDMPLPANGGQELVAAAPGMCILFADGMRYDVGRRLAERLMKNGYLIQDNWRWAALPTVTATSKPAVSPVASEILGQVLTEDMAPILASCNKPVNATSLREAIQAIGYQVLSCENPDSPKDDEARAWIEAGAFDRRGHDLGEDFSGYISQEIDRMADQVEKLIDAGWTSVRIVTDHGWLLMPGGLPKVDLPRHLTLTRWKRCAVIAGASQIDAKTAPWYWNELETFATAPGITCFNASPGYAHGGLSIQECLLPDLFVRREDRQVQRAEIRSLTWVRMRCVVVAENIRGPIIADIRLESPSGRSVVSTIKQLDDEGTVSLIVNADYEESDLIVVLMNQDGSTLAQRKTKVGVSS